MKPRLLDLFCCAGGAARGYQRAGFYVVGVDMKPQPRYAGDEFIQGDALAIELDGFDVIHASPPCQRYSHATAAGAWRSHPDLVASVRERVMDSGKPWVIENVPRAPLINPITLCGTMFALEAEDTDGTVLSLKRHRLFESNMAISAPSECRHRGVRQWAGSYGGARRDKDEARNIRHGGYVPSMEVQQRLLGIDWMAEREMHQAIPPAYTTHIGWQLMAVIS
jgi:DNA (cytosine-5)-methyltransferase 1